MPLAPSFVFCVLLTYHYSVAQDSAIQAIQVNQAPALDGRLNDPVWNNEIPFSGFKMVEPTTGSDPTEKTVVWEIYDKFSLFIGIRCYDSEPRKISANSMKHDNYEERNEDQISWVIMEGYFGRSDQVTSYTLSIIIYI